MECCCCSTLAIAAILALIIFKLFCKKCCKSKEPEILEKNYEKDVVYLYQFPRASTLPSVSPYSLAVESFLRLNNIKYENRFSLKARSKYGLLPFIELNGEHIPDSQLIEERLKKHFNIQPSSEYEESVARATARLVTHHTSKVTSKYRYVDETEVLIDTFVDAAGYPKYLYFLKPLAVFFLRRKAKKALKRSFGLFSNAEFNLLLRKDLDALKGILGDKKFFLGDDISNVDASIFGHVATWYYLPQKGYVARVLDDEYPSLVKWAERVKNQLFPDDFVRK